MRRSVLSLAMVVALGFALTATVAHSGQVTSKKRPLPPELKAPQQVAVVAKAHGKVVPTNHYLALGKGAVPGAELPVEISTSKLHVNHSEGVRTAVCDGNVEVKQGDVTLSCDKLVIEYDMKGAKQVRETRGTPKQFPRDLPDVSNMKSITASGNVKLVQGERMAVAGKAVFDNVNRTITLSENPKLWQGSDRLIGEKIIIYLDENRSDVLSGGGEKKIKMIINPPGEHKKEQEK